MAVFRCTSASRIAAGGGGSVVDNLRAEVRGASVQLGYHDGGGVANFMVGQRSTTRPPRTLPLTVVTGILASVLALLWLFLGDDVARVEILPGCVPSAEAATITTRI